MNKEQKETMKAIVAKLGFDPSNPSQESKEKVKKKMIGFVMTHNQIHTVNLPKVKKISLKNMYLSQCSMLYVRIFKENQKNPINKSNEF